MGPHGAGLSNMMFAEDPMIIELFPESVIKPQFYFLADIFNFEYTPIVANSEGNNLILDTDGLDNYLTKVTRNQTASNSEQ